MSDHKNQNKWSCEYMNYICILSAGQCDTYHVYCIKCENYVGRTSISVRQNWILKRKITILVLCC